MTLILLGVALGVLGYLTYKQIGWCKVEVPTADLWHHLIESPDEPKMPPRRNRRVF